MQIAMDKIFQYVSTTLLFFSFLLIFTPLRLCVIDIDLILIAPDKAVIVVNYKNCVVFCGILASNYEPYTSRGKRFSE